MILQLWPLLLPVAAGSGFFLGRKKKNPGAPYQSSTKGISKGYIQGLNYLLNEEPDKALDVFIKLLEVDSDTVETHLALGSLFRRQGEVDKAIRIHQNLIARPTLTASQKIESMMALGQDYMRAGVFDRAERIFKEITQMSGGKVSRNLKNLLAIYQQEKAWDKALDILKQYEKISGESMHFQMAHCYCELAEQEKGHFDKAQFYLKKALNSDKNSVRASLLQAELEARHGHYRRAIKAYKKVPLQDEAFISETIKPLFECYKQLDNMSACIDYMKELLVRFPRSSIIFILAKQLKDEKGMEFALDFISEELTKHPSLRGLNRLIQWYLQTTYGKIRSKLSMLYDITSKLLENKPLYRCGQCGFSGMHLHWQCPSCKKWGKVKPIHGLEGD
jgi:lipopolysaccharide biosynthesis regulator YciM